ncbi:MAG: HAD-IIIA family hydrolase [Pseudomonadales bacterium]|nr:HAD-IIIA family hydrolase [Pseudomonadales bacterium]
MKQKEADANTLAKARGIKLLALDVDGVMTDGKLYFGHQGESLKSFSILDGLGIKLLRDCGIECAIITGRSSEIVEKRATELSIKHVVQGREDKLTALMELLAQLNLSQEHAAYMGDDLPDLSAIRFCRFGITVANAYPAVKQHADWVCSNSGGSGAVREAADILLTANGHYDDVIARHL